MSTHFDDFDFSDFWGEHSDYAKQGYVGDPFSDADIQALEKELGYKLPKAYIEFMKFQNGGMPKRNCHRTQEETSWAEDHIQIYGIYCIDREKRYSLSAEMNDFWVGGLDYYPPIGIYFADTPSGGHDMVCLDYRECGTEGEPTVVHVDQTYDYKITFLAKDFESFIRGLESSEAFPET